MITTEQMHGWEGRAVLDTAGRKLGVVCGTYEDSESGKPDWLAVRSGVLGRHMNFVPVLGAVEEGGNIRLGYLREQVRAAPAIKDGEALSVAEKVTLRTHYGATVEDFGYDVDDGRERTVEQTEAHDAAQRRAGRRAAKSMPRPEDSAMRPDGTPLRPRN